MRKLILFLLLSICSISLNAQDILGQWNGLLKVQNSQLRIIIHVERFMAGYNATMDSPDQGAKGIPVDWTTFEDSVLKFEMKSIGAKYEGRLQKNNIFSGTFTQMGQSFPLEFSREEVIKEKKIRPQEPLKPYPYYSEKVKFKNSKANATIAGTLTLPKKEGPFPAVILISGSGPQNRDEEIFGHKPFLVLADHLTRKNIAVLRYDDRGTAESTGDFHTATSFDFATDVESAIEFLKTRKEIDHTKIGLIGHSEGGIIAPIVASNENSVGFIILMAGPGIRGDKLLLMQQALIAKAYGQNEKDIEISQSISKGAFDLVVNCNNSKELKADLETYLRKSLKENSDFKLPAGMTEDIFIETQLKKVVSPWMIQFLKYDPAPTLEKVSCPVLAINGSKDLQVPAEINLNAIKTALNRGGNNNITTKELPSLNHMFQECKTGATNEYEAIDQTFSPVALNIISEWILEIIK